MPIQPDTIQEVQPLTAFQENPNELIAQLKATHRPIALTVDGQPEVVLQSVAEYQRLLDQLDEAEAREGIRRGLADLAAGRTRPAHEVFAELDRDYGLQG